MEPSDPSNFQSLPGWLASLGVLVSGIFLKRTLNKVDEMDAKKADKSALDHFIEKMDARDDKADESRQRIYDKLEATNQAVNDLAVIVAGVKK